MKNLKITVSAMMVIMSISGMSASFRFFKKKNNDDNNVKRWYSYGRMGIL